jgi:hypothetical protein
VLKFASPTFKPYKVPVDYFIYEWRHLRLISFTEISTYFSPLRLQGKKNNAFCIKNCTLEQTVAAM